MSPSALQVNEALRGTLLAAMRPAPDAQEEIDSILHRAGATLYSLMADHQVNQRGRCRSCRRPGAVLGLRRRRCRVHGKAQMWLSLPAELLRSLLVGELNQTSVPPASPVSPVSHQKTRPGIPGAPLLGEGVR